MVNGTLWDAVTLSWNSVWSIIISVGEVQYTSSVFRNIETSLRDLYHLHVKLQCGCFVFKVHLHLFHYFTFLGFSATELKIRRQNFTVPLFHVLFYRMIKNSKLDIIFNL